MAARESHFCLSSLPTFRIPPPLLLLLPTKSLLADDGESEIGRQKEIDFCLPPSQTLLTLTITITITIPPLLLSPLQISAGRLQQDRERQRGKVGGRERERERDREREREVWDSSQRGDSSQGGRKLPMLFFSNPFLISGFGTRGAGRG